jgi:hypothetical protein
MILPITITRGAKAIFALGILCVGAAFEGCVGSVQSNSPNPPVTPAPSPISLSVSPASTSLLVSQNQKFTATVQNDVKNKGVFWSLAQSGEACTPGCGSLSSSTTQQITYTAPARVPSPATVTLTATSIADNKKSISATITVTAPPPPPISVSISPSSVSLQISQTQLFTATVQNDTQNMGVTWTLSGGNCANNACGFLSVTALNQVTYTAPDAPPSPAIFTLIAASVADSIKSASGTITVALPPPPSVAVKFCDVFGDPNCTAKNVFSLRQIRDLIIWVNWQNVPTGTHTQTVTIYFGQPSSSPFTTYSNAFAINAVPVGQAQLMVDFPIAGTVISQRQLTGTWTVQVSLDSVLMATQTFQLTP